MKKRSVLAVLTAIFTLAAASIPALSVGNPVVMAAEDQGIVLSGETVECLPNVEGRATWISEEGEIIKATVNPEDGEIELMVYDLTSENSSLTITTEVEEGVKIWKICVPVDAKNGDSYEFKLHVENTEKGVRAVFPITIKIIDEMMFNDIHMADDRECLLSGETNQIEVNATLVRWNSEKKQRDYYDAIDFVGTYQSEDEDIAVVDEGGLVTGVANGETNITVSGKVKFSGDGDELWKEIEGSVYVAVEGEATCIHEWDNGNVTKNADCKNDGEILYTCTKCKNATKTEKIPATGKHNYVGVVTKEATTTETGVKTYTCSVCGDSYTETLPKLVDTKAENKGNQISTKTESPKTGDNSKVGIWMAAAAVACGTLVVISRRKKY